MENIINFSRHLKQFAGLTWLTRTPIFYDRSATPLITALEVPAAAAVVEVVVVTYKMFIS